MGSGFPLRGKRCRVAAGAGLAAAGAGEGRADVLGLPGKGLREPWGRGNRKRKVCVAVTREATGRKVDVSFVPPYPEHWKDVGRAGGAAAGHCAYALLAAWGLGAELQARKSLQSPQWSGRQLGWSSVGISGGQLSPWEDRLCPPSSSTKPGVTAPQPRALSRSSPTLPSCAPAVCRLRAVLRRSARPAAQPRG